MKKKTLKKLLTINTLLLTGILFFPVKVNAQNLLPAFFQNLLEAGLGRNSDFANSRVQVILLSILGVIIVAAIFYAFMAGWKYVRSQGDQGEIDEATKSIKAIFLGLGALMVSIIGTIIVFLFFGSVFFTSDYRSCDNADSVGCIACNSIDGGLPTNWQEQVIQSSNPELMSVNEVFIGASFGPETDIPSQRICMFCEYEFENSNLIGVFPNNDKATTLCK